MVIRKLIYYGTNTTNTTNKKDLRVKKTPTNMFCKSCTNVVSPSTNIINSSSNSINTNTVPNNSPVIIKMDEANQKVIQIAAEKGVDEAVKHMFNPTGDKQLSYAEMRERYG
jgi:hypothetical protein